MLHIFVETTATPANDYADFLAFIAPLGHGTAYLYPRTSTTWGISWLAHDRGAIVALQGDNPQPTAAFASDFPTGLTLAAYHNPVSTGWVQNREGGFYFQMGASGVGAVQNGYPDFVAVIDSLKIKGDVFYTNPGWTIWWIARDKKTTARIDGSITFPASFATDFPGAVAISDLLVRDITTTD